MRVATWGSENDGAIARIEVIDRGSKMWLPTFIHAATEAEAEARAHAFYADELRRFARQSDLTEKRRAAGLKSAEARRKA